MTGVKRDSNAVFAKNLKRCFEVSGAARKDLAEYLLPHTRASSVSNLQNQISRWLSGEIVPQSGNRRFIAAFFGVPDYKDLDSLVFSAEESVSARVAPVVRETSVVYARDFAPCGNCGEIENPRYSRYCKACGQALNPACPGCGAPVGPDFRYCIACGLDLLGPDRGSPL